MGPPTDTPSAPLARSRPGDASGSEKSWSWWYPLIVLAPVILALATIVGSMLSPERSLSELRGVRLGMTAEQVRERFDNGAAATWRSEISGGDLALVREAPAQHDARFELHNGMLVAIRWTLPPDAPEAAGDPIEISPQTVRARSREPSGEVRLVVLARDCPTHAAEVSALIASAP